VPFSGGKIDFDTYGKLIERQIAEGTHGLRLPTWRNSSTKFWTILVWSDRDDNGTSWHKADNPTQSWRSVYIFVDIFLRNFPVLIR
jgi:hypothetical protein